MNDSTISPQGTTGVGVDSATASGPATRLRSWVRSPAAPLAAIWFSSALVAVGAPDMVSGSAQEHLPLASFTVWLWTIAATGYVLLATRVSTPPYLTWGTTVIWLAVLLVAVLSPVMETGSDPTRIPLAAVLAPAMGALATGMLSVHSAASAQDRPTRSGDAATG